MLGVHGRPVEKYGGCGRTASEAQRQLAVHPLGLSHPAA